MLTNPIQNKWIDEFLNNYKKKCQDNLSFKIGDFVDYFADNCWNHGKIIDLSLEKLSFQIMSDSFTKNKYFYIPFKDENLICQEFTHTPQWRHFEYLKNCNKIQIYICNNENEECTDLFCQHEKKWVSAQIVYICNNSNYLLVVFHLHLNLQPQSQWFPIDSRYLKLL
jgi:hypothetical protein